MQQLPVDARQPLWLVSCQSCLFIRFSLAGLPRRFHASGIAQKVKETSPFTQTDYQTLITGDTAEIWLWDKGAQQAAQQQARADVDFLVIPEHLLLAPVEGGFVRRTDPARTILEKWRDGTLEGYRSYGPAVSEHDLDDFQRTFAAHQAPWQKAGFNYLRHPRHLPRWWEPKSLAQPGVIGLLLIALSASLLLGVLGNWIGWQWVVATQRTAVRSAMAEVTPQLAARDQFLRIQSRNRARAARLGRPEPLAVAAEFEYLVGDQYNRLLEWDLQGNRLKATIEAGETSSRSLLEALQQSPLFLAVRAEPGLRPEATVIIAELAESLRTPYLFVGGQAVVASGEAH